MLIKANAPFSTPLEQCRFLRKNHSTVFDGSTNAHHRLTLTDSALVILSLSKYVRWLLLTKRHCLYELCCFFSLRTKFTLSGLPMGGKTLIQEGILFPKVVIFFFKYTPTTFLIHKNDL